MAWLAAVSRHAALDPVEQFIGAVRTGVSDWADQHDKYLGQSHVGPARGEDRPGE